MANKKRANGEGSWGKKNINGNEYYVFTKTYGGVRKPFYGKTKTEAKQKAEKYELKNKLASTKDIQKMSFYSYCHNWLFDWRKTERKKEIKRKTFDYYDYIIEQHISGSKLGNMQIKYINSCDRNTIERHINEYLDLCCQKYAKSTIDGIYTLINQVFKFGLKHNDFNDNFMINISKVTEDSVQVKVKETRSLEYDEVRKLWNEMLRVNTKDVHVNGKVGSYVYGIGAQALLFCCYTGLRWGEVSRLTWDRIDFDKYILSIENQFVTIKNRNPETKDVQHYVTVDDTPKSKDSVRFIPLADEALELLEMVKKRYPRLYKPNNLIFSSTGKPYSDSNANRLLKCMCIRSGIEPVTSHELRHTFASILLNDDEQNLYAVSNMLGHSNPEVTYKKYIHIFEQKKAETIKIFNKLKDKQQKKEE